MKNLNKISISLLAIAMTFISCGQPKQKEDVKKAQTAQSGEGYELYKTYCIVCHNPNSASHDSIIAPPMIAVKTRYSVQYNTKEEFVNAVVNWASDPKEESSLMRGAVMQYKVMPKQAFKTEDLTKIASYIYDNNIEAPKWFAQHQKDMQGNGKGMMMKNQN